MLYVAMTSSFRVLAMPFDANAGTIGPPHQLFGGSQDLSSFQPSPDGKMIVFRSVEELFVAEIDGMRIRQLTVDPAMDRGGDWSPDGRTLYFYSNRDGNWNIWSIRADGSGLRQITDANDLQRTGVRDALAPVVSPDGRTLLVQTERGSALVHLDRPPGQRVELLPFFLAQPRWSPDGQFIAARKGIQFSLSGPIFLYSLRTRQAEPIASSGAVPHWTPDGKKIVYFERNGVRILDLDRRTSAVVPFTPPAGMEVDLRGVISTLARERARLSRDAATLYVCQTNEQSDVWAVRFPPD